MLESMITSPPPKGIEPDYPYDENTMLRVVKEPVAMEMTYGFTGSAMTIHYGDQNAPSSGILYAGPISASYKISIPANVTEFFLKQVIPDAVLERVVIRGTQMTDVTWSPRFNTRLIIFLGSSKLRNVSKYSPGPIKSLRQTFSGCSVFDTDISSWSVAEVTDMTSAFGNCNIFNQDLSGWDVSKVTNMDYVFENCTAFNQDLSGWDVSKVTSRKDFDKGATAWLAANKPKFPN